MQRFERMKRKVEREEDEYKQKKELKKDGKKYRAKYIQANLERKKKEHPGTNTFL
jgi:phage shock protein A